MAAGSLAGVSRRLPRRLGTILLVLGVLGGPASAAQGQTPAPVPRLDWSPCGNGFECSRAVVPLDHRRPAGPRISLALIRLPAADPERRVGSLFVNPGGPGGSGIDLVRRGYRDFPERLRRRFDLVGFDPRGVGQSAPVRCWSTARYRRAFARTRSRPSSRALRRTLAEAEDFGRACVRASGELLPYVGTQSVARDLDLLRAAVGDDRLTYLGYSYGTYIGTVYADLFPARVRAAVLDGAYDPRRYANDPYAYDRGQFVAVEGALSRFLGWCARERAGCRFGAGRPRAALDRLVAGLDRRPARVGRRGRGPEVGGFGLLYQVAFALNGGRAGWPGLGASLARAQRRSGPLIEEAASPSLFEFLGQNTAVECADRLYPRSVTSLRARLSAHARLGGRLGPAFAYGPPGYDHSHAAACVRWPAARASRHPGPFRASGSAPILVVGTTGDPDTPYPDAVALERTLESARLVTFEGEGHTGFGRSRCVTEHATEYLLDGTLPPSGTRCADEPPPARRPAAARASRIGAHGLR
jgi:pimeloyl-ACP methyl ester carboxylesterase